MAAAPAVEGDVLVLVFFPGGAGTRRCLPMRSCCCGAAAVGAGGAAALSRPLSRREVLRVFAAQVQAFDQVKGKGRASICAVGEAAAAICLA